jgi:8-oxo-dGTP diphosphatase
VVSNFSAEDRNIENVGREYPNRPVVGVGGVVVCEGRALLARRGKPPLEGQWSIPGGMLETGETILEGVRRELKEETGLDVRVGELIEVFERISLDGEGKTQYHYVVLDYFCEPLPGEACAASDAAAIAWVTEADLERYGITTSARQVIEKAFAIAKGRT